MICSCSSSNALIELDVGAGGVGGLDDCGNLDTVAGTGWEEER